MSARHVLLGSRPAPRTLVAEQRPRPGSSRNGALPGLPPARHGLQPPLLRLAAMHQALRLSALRQRPGGYVGLERLRHCASRLTIASAITYSQPAPASHEAAAVNAQPLALARLPPLA